MKYITFVFILIYIPLQAQEPRTTFDDKTLTLNIDTKARWHQGAITLASGENLKGDVWFNLETQLVLLRVGIDTKSFSAQSVHFFYYFDEKEEVEKKFYAIPYESDLEYERMGFFEVLKETKSLALLSNKQIKKVKRPHHLNNNNNPPELPMDNGVPPENPMMGSGGVTINDISYGKLRKYKFEVETLYFADDQGNIEPYIETKDKLLKDNHKVIDKDLPKKFFGDQYPDLKRIAKNNNLNWKKKEDLIRILEHYEAMN